jgi:hypothetical protein
VALVNGNGRALLLGLVAGAVAATAGRELFEPLRRIGRPLAKTAIKSGLTAIERGQQGVALLGEHLEDLMAEVEAERQQDAAAHEQS